MDTKHYDRGSRIFGATKCEHGKRSITDACSTCTECFICFKAVGDGDLLAYLENQNTIYCHPSCMNPKMVKELRLIEDENGISIRLYTPAPSINPRIPSKSHTCKCCGVVCKAEEETLVYDLIGTRFYYHTSCLQYSDRCCVCKNGPTHHRFIMIENKLYHENCCPRYICVVCSGPGIHYDLSTWYTITGKEIYIHRKCAESIKCVSCHEEFDNTRYTAPRIKNDGAGMQHCNCNSTKCPVCYKSIGTAVSVKIPTNDKSTTTDGSGYIHCHKSCAEKLTCTKCKLPCENIEEFIIEDLNNHHKDCSSETCSICNKIIGPNSQTIIDDNVVYHTSCLNLAICYVCRGLGYGEKTFDTGVGFRHINCSIKKCHECYQYMGQSQGLIIEGKLYHGDPIRAPLCSPVCDCCSTRDFHNKEINLKLQPNGKYRHTTCDGSPCAVCSLPLGRTETVRYIHNSREEDPILIHKQCCFTCQKCDSTDPNMNKIGPDKYMIEENKKTLPRITKRAWVTLYLVLTHKPSGVNIPRDVVRLILETFIQNREFRILSPIRKSIFDFRTICNSFRCTVTDVCICGDVYFWSYHPKAGCHPVKCRHVTDAMYDIMDVIFEKRDLPYSWPESEQIGLNTINIAMVKMPLHKLDANKAALYRIMMDSITVLIELRQPKDMTESVD